MKGNSLSEQTWDNICVRMSSWCCHIRKRDNPICVTTDVNRHLGLVSLNVMHINMRGLNFLVTISKTSVPVLLLQSCFILCN